MIFTATNILWLTLILSFFSLFLGFTLGLFFASKFDVALRFNVRNQMEFYAKEMNKKLEQETKFGIKTEELMPPGLGQDYGLPRELK